MGATGVLFTPEYVSLTADQKGVIFDKLGAGQPVNESLQGFLEANKENAAKAVAKAPKAKGEANPPPNPNKSSAHVVHAKAAREAAKEAVLTAKALRAELKKDPGNKQLEEHVKSAEKAAKAARSAARKAEKATDAKEAEKYAAQAKAHADKVSGFNKSAPKTGGPVVTKAVDVKKAAAAAKSTSTHTVPSDTTKALQKKADKLKEAASQKNPNDWSASKVAAKAAAQKALIDHADPTTPDELNAAADALDKVADQAQKAGAYWGHAYKALANEMRDAAVPTEHFSLATGSGDHSKAPSVSARPISEIHGDVVSAKSHAEHRKIYTASLTGDQKKAALKYSGSAYSQINTNLRQDGAPDATVKHLDAAIAKAGAPRDMLVHRGVSGPFARKLYAGLKPGDEIVEKAYSSTSAGGTSAFGGDVELHITVPKGYPAAPIPSHHENEREYLLRRNTRFVVTKIETESGGKIRAHVTVVHDGKD